MGSGKWKIYEALEGIKKEKVVERTNTARGGGGNEESGRRGKEERREGEVDEEKRNLGSFGGGRPAKATLEGGEGKWKVRKGGVGRGPKHPIAYYAWMSRWCERRKAGLGGGGGCPSPLYAIV